MGKIAFVFPGQGAQAVGMGKDIYEAEAASRSIFEAADKALGLRLTNIIFEGPENELKLTYNTQPALLATSIAYLELFRSRHGLQPDYAAGHSLGEYSALVAAGVLHFEDAVRTVRSRGEFMDAAVPAGQGAMAAVLGAEREALQALCAEVSRGGAVAELANLNCPGQIVVSGSKEGVQAIVERGKEAGAKRVIPLEVSGPFHSSLMKPASERLSSVLTGVEMNRASIPVVANVTAKPVQEPGEIRQLLVDQVHSSVLWEDSVTWLIEQGVDTFVEIGSGTVLAGLIKKIDRNVKVYSVNSLESIEKFQLETNV
ncbi:MULTISPECIES: ACP S-malonyltransferase [unclassified Paenibacillus]|uniref:ACP S-malonyltransferase n=1 Tax=unclassified Paenibacillus TaxID=185978 RepID=UPI001AE2474F|nr:MULTISPECIES: ACP S-malonyltransferase [unclassified Paenibacillus]MBP1156049.1 [acyl-carrier-protein] S-malonyltransferase [Paenibacillus sp. PvP091]MBP1168565.1 [acyl-carrier-protein] S-malonyltransferase [Paenibacillus sp. PvR098]MBP2439593.1 [acyl-carrier-protein] S-malonyltransferase [Paenibacillus sp. PvP052]